MFENQFKILSQRIFNLQSIDLGNNKSVNQKSWITFFKILFEKDKQGSNIQEF
jgi:hypothetical protein